MAVSSVAVALAWLVVLPAPIACARHKLFTTEQDLADEEQQHPDCKKMKKVGDKLCTEVLQKLDNKGLKAMPKPDAGGGINLGMFTIAEGDKIAKLTSSKADFEHYTRVTRAKSGIAQDPNLAWPREVITIQPDYYIFVLPKAPGADIGTRISKMLYGSSPTPDGTFMKAVGKAAGNIYQQYCGGCSNSKACHGDFQTSNAFITEQNKVTLIDLDSLGSGQIPEHDIVHMEGSIQILEKAYIPNAGSKEKKEAWVNFFQQMKNSLQCGWEEVCPEGVPGRGKRCQGSPRQQAGATGRAQGAVPTAIQGAPGGKQGAAPAASRGLAAAPAPPGEDEEWCKNYISNPTFCSHMCDQDNVRKFCAGECVRCGGK